MRQVEYFNDEVGLLWSVTDLLCDDLKAREYGQIILPLTMLRRMDCVLEPTKDAVVAKARKLTGGIGNPGPILLRAAGQRFYNASSLNFARLLDEPLNIAANLRSYIAGYDNDTIEMLHAYDFDNQIARLDSAGSLYRVISRFANTDLHPDLVPNQTMGHILEELRKLSEANGKAAGEHSTAATKSLTALANSAPGTTSPPPTLQDVKGSQSFVPGPARGSQWPQWPAAWPDGSRGSGPAKTGW